MANYGVLSPYLYVTYKSAGVNPADLGGSAFGPPATTYNYNLEIANGNDWSVQLYAAPGLNATTLSPVPGAIVTLGTTLATAGIWASTVIATIPGTTGGASGTATLELVAWYNAGGAITSFSQALADGVPIGVSAVADITGLGGGSPPATAPTLPESLDMPQGFDGGIIFGVPEPSTLALGVMGASAFLTRFRPKS